jgi:hypothetical protein
MAHATWGVEDPLLRGDHAESVTLPDPQGHDSIVRHVLYIDGAGRSTPYSSTTEDAATARMFATRDGHVWHTFVARVEAEGLRWISMQELLSLLVGKGKGNATWPRASEVQQARAHVEQWAEHLVDFRALKGRPEQDVQKAVVAIFSEEPP